MSSEPTTHKFVAVLNKKVEVGKLMNALGHLAVGFGAAFVDKEAMRFDSYFDKDGGEHPSISDNPFIILSADNSNQICSLRNVLKINGIPYADFTSTMTVGTFIEQKQRTNETPETELDYYGICFFGEKNQISELTKKFSLWK